MKREPVPFRAPADQKSTKLSPASKHAAGLSSVWQATKVVTKSLGLKRGSRALFSLNQVDGVDCPGCAWPDPQDERSKLGEYCENGAKAIAEEATRKSIGGEFFKEHSIQELSMLSDFQLGQLGRIREPLLLPENENHYRPISWEQAFELIGKHLNALNNPNEAIFYTSGRTSNEAAFLYQLLARKFGTNNLPDCSNMCHESSGVALAETLGIGKGSVTLEDFYETDLILIMGQNPGTNHPRMLTALEKAKAQGASIITANPLPEAGLMGFRNPQKAAGLMGLQTTTLTDLYLPLKINSDLALLKAIMMVMWQQEQTFPGKAFNMEFIQSHTDGFHAFLNDLKGQDFKMLCEMCGLPEALVEQAALKIVESSKIIVCWAMGLTQHVNAVDTIKEIVNLLLLKGSIGIPGGGSCPVRGHSNVQGDRTMGIWENPPAWFLDNLAEAFQFEPPRDPGFNTVEAIQAMHRGDAKVFMAMGGNFHSATPDTDYTSEALQKCQLTVQISTKLNRSHLVTGKTALILPCLARTDKDLQASGYQKVSVENSMGVIHSSKGVLDPVSEQLKSEPAIVAGIADATLNSTLPWSGWVEDYNDIRDLIEKVIPGFDDYNERLDNPGGFYLPNVARERKFLQGKAHFSVTEATVPLASQGEYVMMTIRSHDQFNTTIYGLDDRYRGVANDRKVIFMHPEDMKTEGLEALDLVNVSSNYRNKVRRVYNFKVVPYQIPPGNLASYFPETNPLVPVDLVAHKSHTPVSKSIVVRVEKVQG